MQRNKPFVYQIQDVFIICDKVQVQYKRKRIRRTKYFTHDYSICCSYLIFKIIIQTRCTKEFLKKYL